MIYGKRMSAGKPFSAWVLTVEETLENLISVQGNSEIFRTPAWKACALMLNDWKNEPRGKV